MPVGSRAVAGQCKHYAYSTEKGDIHWPKRFVHCHKKWHPQEIGEKGICALFTWWEKTKASEPHTNSPGGSAAVGATLLKTHHIRGRLLLPSFSPQFPASPRSTGIPGDQDRQRASHKVDHGPTNPYRIGDESVPGFSPVSSPKPVADAMVD